jgi:Transcriptional regulator
MPSFEQIKYFLEIVRCGSMNKAAERLYISQPSLSKQLRRLEKSLGCTLLKRNYDGMQPTPQGRYFYEEMNRLLNDMDEVVQKVRNMKEAKQVHIGGLANLITYFLPQFLDKIKANGENYVTVSICLSNQELIAGVKKGLYDIALLSNAEPEEEIVIEPIMTEPLYVIFQTGHRLSMQQNISFVDIVKNENLVLYKDPCTIRASIRKYCNQLNIMPNIVVELDLTESLLTYVSRGDGVTILPAIVAHNIQSTFIDIREINLTPIYREISIATKKENIGTYLSYFH